MALTGCNSFLVALDAVVNALLGFCAVVDAVFSLDVLLFMVGLVVVVVGGGSPIGWFPRFNASES